MGGGGGGYVAPYDTWINQIASYPNAKQPFESKRGNYANEADWYAAYGGGQDNPAQNLISPEMSRDIFTKLYGTYTPPPAPPAPAPAAAPAPAPAPAYVPDPGPALATEPTGTPIGAGGAVGGPSAAGNGLGDALGDTVLKPPKYWVGGLNDYDAGTRQGTGRTTGSLKTSNTG